MTRTTELRALVKRLRAGGSVFRELAEAADAIEELLAEREDGFAEYVKAAIDAATHGIGIVGTDGERIAPEDFFAKAPPPDQEEGK